MKIYECGDCLESFEEDLIEQKTILGGRDMVDACPHCNGTDIKVITYSCEQCGHDWSKESDAKDCCKNDL